MIVIADNDILKKLAACDLFAEMLGAFSTSAAEIFVLDTARHVLRRKRHRDQLGEESYLRLLAFIDSVRIIGSAPDAAEVAILAEQDDIDAGEAVLLSVARHAPDSILATGDKRCLVALANADEALCGPLKFGLANRIFCFEQIIEKILNAYGFAAIRDKLILGRERDKSLGFTIRPGPTATEANLREGLKSYIEHLRKQTGSLLSSL